MTTIAYRAGIVAADTQCTRAGTIGAFMQKIVRNARGDVAGAVGSASWAAAFHKWFLAGEIGDSPKIERIDGNDIGKGIIFRSPVGIIFFEGNGPFPLTAPYFATGSGQDAALGAMWHGASAIEAVRAAIEHDESTGGEITVLHVGDDE